MFPCSSWAAGHCCGTLHYSELSCAIKDLFGSFLGSKVEICVDNKALHCGVIHSQVVGRQRRAGNINNLVF